MPRATLVVTTIFDPVLLEDYFRNFQAHGRLEEVEVIVIPDRKTPEAAFRRCSELARRGLRVTCPTIEEQEEFLRRIGLRADFVPYDSDNRRNVGFLMALESGPDLLISIDDDNYCRQQEDFIGEHAVVCGPPGSADRVNAQGTGWFNICEMLELDVPATVYPRGFPMYARHRDANLVFDRAVVDVQVNAGLWLVDPDVDAMTWLVSPTRATGVRRKEVVLGDCAWSPVNTQNTALRISALPAYYYVRMGYPIGGMQIDRYGDIFSGYFLQACVRHVSGSVRIGGPVAEHRRNSHNYLKDAGQELAGLMIVEELLPWLTSVELQGSTVLEAFEALSHLLEEAVAGFRGTIWTDATRGYFHSVAHSMRQWTRACATISGGVPAVA